MSNVDIALIALVAGYGLILGVPNVLTQFSARMRGRALHQSDLGKMLDILWLSGVFYLGMKFYL